MNKQNQSVRRVAILGAGYISKYHVNAVRALPGLTLAAVCDLNRTKAEGLAGQFGIPKVYSSLETMLAEEKLDAVHVLLPPEVHGAPIKRILDAGVDVLAEKPLAITSAECKELTEHAHKLGRKLGVSHNFLFSPIYERFLADLKQGRFGRLDQVDIVWNKELGQVKGGPFSSWLFARPENVLFEVGPHAFAHLAHIVGEPDRLHVYPHDRVTLPLGREFYRRWEIHGFKDATALRVRFSFIDGFTQQYIQVRGTSAAALVDFENNTYVINEHTPLLLDVDRYANVTRAALTTVQQASTTLGRFILSKMGLDKEGAPFQQCITRVVRAYYEGLDRGSFDERVSPPLATAAVALAERVTKEAKLKVKPAEAVPDADAKKAKNGNGKSSAPETVLVLGGTGFIGQALVQKLREAGYGVRLLVRNPNTISPEIKKLGVGLARGDMMDTASVEAALPGIEHVFHLARGYGEIWDDYVRTDVEPTKRLAEVCLKHGVKGFYYTSSIAIYYAGSAKQVITEDTPPSTGVARANLYARAKIEIEKDLFQLHKERGLPAVIFRPGIVLGRGGNPLHGGVAGWPYSSVSRLWGDGNAQLPIVLVDDCAEAMVRALKVPGIAGQSFNLVGDPLLTAQEYLDELERCAGIHFRRVPTSSVRYFAEEIGKYVIKTVGRDPHRRLPSWENWDGRTCKSRFDATRTKQVLGWSPTQSRDEVVREGIKVPAEQFLT
jgi:nucleoside-diphosphate-sugar epimerase/predicted dehydrogenase